MSEINNNNNFDNLDGFVGQIIDGQILESLIQNGRIQFPMKNVGAPSAVSQGVGGTDSCDDKQKGDRTDLRSQDENDLLNMVDSVKENESFVKTLEDMRDDMLAGMNIPPANNKISDAAKQLGSKDGNITKDIYDKAKLLTDPSVNELFNGFSSPIAAITGNGNIKTPTAPCDKLTNDFLGQVDIELQITSNDREEAGQDTTVDQQIAKSDQSFAELLKQMFMYLLNELFWNHIWTRMWVGIFDMVEKLIAKPIDTPIMILRSIWAKPPWYRLTEDNYYKFGPVHIVLNLLKLLFLCKIPKGAWSDYKPEVNIKVYIYTKGMVQLVGICSDLFENGYDACAGTENDPEIYDEDSGSNESIDRGADDGAEQAFDKAESKLRKMFPTGGKNCPKTNLNKSFEDVEQGVGVHKCIDAAHTVLKAVINDALYNNRVGV